MFCFCHDALYWCPCAQTCANQNAIEFFPSRGLAISTFSAFVVLSKTSCACLFWVNKKILEWISKSWPSIISLARTVVSHYCCKLVGIPFKNNLSFVPVLVHYHTCKANYCIKKASSISSRSLSWASNKRKVAVSFLTLVGTFSKQGIPPFTAISCRAQLLNRFWVVELQSNIIMPHYIHTLAAKNHENMYKMHCSLVECLDYDHHGLTVLFMCLFLF